MFVDYKKKKPKEEKKKHDERKQSEIEAMMIHKNEKRYLASVILFIATANKSNSFKKKKL